MRDSGEPSLDSEPSQSSSGRRTPAWIVARISLGFIVLIALILRFWGLDHTSLWFDETISMRVARAANLAGLIQRLDQIDGSRAPLHPIVLQCWLRIFGTSDAAGRSLSAVCGLITVVMIYVLGKQAFDRATGLWAAWLAAVCPPLVHYSRETRMYALLVLLTCLSWLVFFSFRRSAGLAQCLAYGLLLIALVYSHPLGLFMVAAHGLSYLLVRSDLRLPVNRWIVIQLAVILAIAPWMSRYLDHGTDYPLPRYPIRYLLAVPIEYIGGNSIVLIVCLAIIGVGLLSRNLPDRTPRLSIVNPFENVVLLSWTVVPPLLMYLYSWRFQPIFGPARYHLFTAPAYLILVAHGLSKLHQLIRWPAVAVAFLLSVSLIQADVYTLGVKADWRGLAKWLDQNQRSSLPTTVVVHPSDPRFLRDELEAARYYLRPRFEVVLAGELSSLGTDGEPRTIYHAYCLTKARKINNADPDTLELHGLIVKQERPGEHHSR